MIEQMRKVFDIHIITLTPYSINKSKKENHNKKSGIQYKSEGNITAVEIIKVPIATFLLTGLTIKRVVKKQKFDVCLTTGPYFGFATLISKVGCPVIYEDTDRFEYFAKNKLSQLISRTIEKYCIKKATHIISVGYSLAESAKQIRGDHNVSCIPNGVNYKIFSEFSNEKSRENIMIYVGTVSEWSGLDLVIRSIPQIKKEVPDIKLIVVGDGAYLNELKKISKKLEVNTHIELLGKKEYNEIPEILSKCNIGLAVYPEIDLMKYAFTLKLIEYMAAGLPVITTNVGDGAQIVKESNSGFVIDYTVESFSNAVINLIKDDELRYSMSRNGTKYAKNFDWDDLASLEISALNHVIAEHGMKFK